MQDHLDDKYVGLEVEEEDPAKDGKEGQKYHEQCVRDLFDSVAFLPCLYASVAQESVEGDNEGLEEELASWEPQPVQFKEKQAES